MKARIKKLEIYLECEMCRSNDLIDINDPYNMDLSEDLSGAIEEGWVFYQDSEWNKKSWLKDPADPEYSSPTPYRDLFSFCCNECFKDWLESEGERDTDWDLCTKEDLENYFADDCPYYVEIIR